MAVVVNVYGKADMKQIEAAERSLAAMKREVAGQPSVWQRAGGVITSTAAKIGSALAVAGLAKFVKSSVDAASDLSESTSKATVVYGKHAASILEWSKSSATGLGMSQQAALEAAGTYGNLFTAMGMGQPKAADMSKSLIGLATDLASFNNIDPSVALDKLRAGLVGETEPLRALGVNLTAVGVQEEAYRLGLAKTGEELTASQKAQAAYSLIMAQTKTAQGDFARTSGGLANQQRILKASFTDLSAKVGQAVLPVVTSLTTRAVALLGGFLKLPGPVQKVAIGLGAVGAAALILLPFMGHIASAVKLTAAAYRVLFVAKTQDGIVTRAGLVQYGILRAKMLAQAVASKAVAAAQWLVNAAMSANPLGLIVIAIAGLVAAFVILWKKSDAFRGFWLGLWEHVKSAFAAVWPTIKAVASAIGAGIQWLWDTVSAGVRAFWDWAGPFITAAVTLWWQGIKTNVALIVAVVSAAWDAISAAVRWFWGWAGPFIKGELALIVTIVRTGFNVVRTVAEAVWDAISAVVRVASAAISANVRAVAAVAGFVADAWRAMRGAVSGAIGAVVDLASDFGSRIKRGVGDLGRLLYGVGEDVVRGLLNGITNAWHWITDKLHSLISGLSSAAKKALGINSPSKVFAEIGRGVGEGFATGIDATARMVAAAAGGMAGAATGGAAPVPAFAGAAGGRSVVIMPGAVSVTIEAGAAGGSPEELTGAVRAGVDPALAQLARAIGAV